MKSRRLLLGISSRKIGGKTFFFMGTQFSKEAAGKHKKIWRRKFRGKMYAQTRSIKRKSGRLGAYYELWVRPTSEEGRKLMRKTAKKLGKRSK